MSNLFGFSGNVFRKPEARNQRHNGSDREGTVLEMKSPGNHPARGHSETSLALFSAAGRGGGELDDLVYLGHFLFTI